MLAGPAWGLVQNWTGPFFVFPNPLNHLEDIGQVLGQPLFI